MYRAQVTVTVKLRGPEDPPGSEPLQEQGWTRDEVVVSDAPGLEMAVHTALHQAAREVCARFGSEHTT